MKFDLHDNCVTVNAVHDCACCGWLSLLESYHTSRYSQHDVRQKVLLLLWLLYDSTLHHQTLYDSTLHHQTLLYIYVWSSFVPLLYFFWLLVFTLSIGHGSLCAHCDVHRVFYALTHLYPPSITGCVSLL